MKRWAVFWACLSVVPISFDARPGPDQIAAQPTVPRAEPAEGSGAGNDQPGSIAPSALAVDSSP